MKVLNYDLPFIKRNKYYNEKVSYKFGEGIYDMYSQQRMSVKNI